MNVGCSAIVSIVLMLLVLLPGAHGISMDISAGDGDGSFLSKVEMEPSSDSTITDRTALSLDGGVGIAREALAASRTGSGNLNQKHVVSNLRGDYVMVSLKVTDADSWTYDYSVYPSEGSGKTSSYVSASETLSATNAAAISGTAMAANRERDFAQATTTLDQGSISGFRHSARASSTATEAKTSWSGASGSNIHNSIWAVNNEGDGAQVTGEVFRGRIASYSGTAAANISSARASHKSTTASGKPSGQNPAVDYSSWAYNARFDGAFTGIKIRSGSMNRYSGASSSKKTSASANVAVQSAAVSGGDISTSIWGGHYYGQSFSSTRRDLSVANLKLTNGRLDRVSVNGVWQNGYVARSSGSSSTTSAYQSRIRAKGDLTNIVSWARNHQYNLEDIASVTSRNMGRQYATSAKTSNKDNPTADASLSKGRIY